MDVDAADDLVHDILLKVLQNENKLSELNNPIAWIFTIAKNTITDYHRKNSKLKFTNEIDNLKTADSNKTYIDKEFAACLRPLINDLEPKYEQALLLTDIQGIKQKDAAERVGISVSGMKSRIQRARRKLKDQILECCAIEVDRFGQIVDYEKKSRYKDSEDSCC